MDVLLLDADTSVAQALRRHLPPGCRLVRASASALGGGAWRPDARHATAVVLVADAPSATTLRLLHRSRYAEQLPCTYLLTSPGSRGETMLRAISGSVPPGPADMHWRSAASLGLTALLTLQRLLHAQKA